MIIKFNIMKTLKNTSLILIFLLGWIFTACEDTVSDPLDLEADVTISSFKVGNIEGDINNEKGTITVLVPYGTDLSAIAPVIAFPANATVSPASGVAQNFTFSANTPIEYKVFNGNVFNTYKVTVKEIKAEITAFRIGSSNGIINQGDHSILIYLPVGTDVTGLSPVVEYTSGASISPASGSYVDFTSPVDYTLTYQGEIFSYTVTVILGEEPKLPLVIYNGENVLQQWEVLGAGTLNYNADNPKQDGINTTLRCVSFEHNVNGEGWHGGALFGKVNIDPAEYDRFSMMVLKEVAGDVQLEIQSAGDANKDWLRVWYEGDALGEWQELIFQIPPGRTAIINTILVMPHDHAVALPIRPMYWDELKALPKE